MGSYIEWDFERKTNEQINSAAHISESLIRECRGVSWHIILRISIFLLWEAYHIILSQTVLAKVSSNEGISSPKEERIELRDQRLAFRISTKREGPSLGLSRSRKSSRKRAAITGLSSQYGIGIRSGIVARVSSSSSYQRRRFRSIMSHNRASPLSCLQRGAIVKERTKLTLRRSWIFTVFRRNSPLSWR